MPGTSIGSGGKRPGAGRKAGKDWHSARPKKARQIAKQNIVEIMETGRDPLLSLLEIADNPETPVDLRVKAYQAALPYCRPRLSMKVTADATPKDGQQEVSHTDMLDRLLRMLDPLAKRPAVIEAKDAAEVRDEKGLANPNSEP